MSNPKAIITPIENQSFNFDDDKGKPVSIQRTIAFVQMPGVRFPVQMYLPKLDLPLGVDYEADYNFKANKRFAMEISFGAITPVKVPGKLL